MLFSEKLFASIRIPPYLCSAMLKVAVRHAKDKKYF